MLMVDDGTMSISSYFDGLLKLNLTFHAAERLGARFSLKKLEVFTEMVVAIGYVFKKGHKSVPESKVNDIRNAAKNLRNPKLMRRLVGKLAFIPEAVPIGYSRAIGTLIRWS